MMGCTTTNRLPGLTSESWQAVGHRTLGKTSRESRQVSYQHTDRRSQDEYGKIL